ncbi:hypothetical protein [Flavobacterium sp. S87F.05.LMB.W.Kidney.N]|uniref:hypothetical protein n=1 Tax=Flavobacterium sp. S87F.05.LMB.W.Kidney.N TaxID=1278758 RepID=UPI0010667EB3|nr:hypothetical protein [Flavobacterium sp. S87F.05.LMB.W.Kidney.N]TDX13900.1 hypothetical protein EDB96_0613 [Flavobacterium sp. S87F.05.LMB.W.Kidney.N]
MKHLSIHNKTNILDRIKQLTLLISLLIQGTFVFAQNSQNKNAVPSISDQETIFLHSNTTTFLTGETLFFKLYCLNPLNNKTSPISKIAYVELIDSEKKSLQKNKIYLDNGIGNGEYFIPTTLKTGNYKVIAYTKWMLNNVNSQKHEIDIFIINPFQTQEPNDNITFDIPDPTKKTTAIQNINSNSGNDKRIDFEFDKESYYTRDKVNLKLKTLTEATEKGNYSVSIRKIDQIPTIKQLTASEFAKKSAESYVNTPNTFNYIPEIRSELITGSITSNTNRDVSNKSIALSLPGKEYVLKIVRTNAQGKFAFLLDQFPNFPNAILQVLDDKQNDFVINLDAFPKFDTSSLQFTSKLNLSPDLKKDIEERSTASQIQNAYYQIKKDSLVTEAVMNPFFSTVEKTYVLDDYTRFPTLKENIVEVIIELYYRRNNGKYQLHVRNLQKDLEIYGPPLVLVDGLLIQDPSDLFDYNMANVNKVSLITEPYVYGPNLYGGLVSFETKDNEFSVNYAKKYLKTMEIQRPNPEKIYNNPDYSAGHKLQRIPDYRYQLLWKPNIKLETKEDNLSFYTSDIKGDFEVVLEGFTESGQPIYVSKSITVK